MSDLIFVDIKSKQYRVVAGEAVICDFFDQEIGSEVVLDLVLLDKDGEVVIDPNALKHYCVRAKIIDNFRGDKMFICRMKRRKRYKRRIGHRQNHSLLLIEGVFKRD